MLTLTMSHNSNTRSPPPPPPLPLYSSDLVGAKLVYCNNHPHKHKLIYTKKYIVN